jgi:hypothetical protein
LKLCKPFDYRIENVSKKISILLKKEPETLENLQCFLIGIAKEAGYLLLMLAQGVLQLCRVANRSWEGKRRKSLTGCKYNLQETKSMENQFLQGTIL